MAINVVELEIAQEDDLKEDEEKPAARKWYHKPWVKHSLIWIPMLISACLLVAGIILVIFFRGRVRFL